MRKGMERRRTKRKGRKKVEETSLDVKFKYKLGYMSPSSLVSFLSFLLRRFFSVVVVYFLNPLMDLWIFVCVSSVVYNIYFFTFYSCNNNRWCRILNGDVDGKWHEISTYNPKTWSWFLAVTQNVFGYILKFMLLLHQLRSTQCTARPFDSASY